jgi:hypothetical protein
LNKTRPQRRFVPEKKVPEAVPENRRPLTSFAWQRNLAANKVMQIQKRCGHAMTLWGYNLLESSVQVSTL